MKCFKKKKKKNSDFGSKAILKKYTFCDLFKDSLCPAILSGIFIVICIFFDAESLVILSKALNLSLDVLPAILGLIVAGYTILVSFYWSDTAEKVKELSKGPELLKALNADFALVIILIILSLVYAILGELIINLNIPFKSHNVINYIALSIILYLLFLSLKLLKDVVVDIFNIGQLSIKLKNNNNQ